MGGAPSAGSAGRLALIWSITAGVSVFCNRGNESMYQIHSISRRRWAVATFDDLGSFSSGGEAVKIAAPLLALIEKLKKDRTNGQLWRDLFTMLFPGDLGEVTTNMNKAASLGVGHHSKLRQRPVTEEERLNVVLMFICGSAAVCDQVKAARLTLLRRQDIIAPQASAKQRKAEQSNTTRTDATRRNAT